jgi:site-specific recombinase XerD
MDDVIEAFRLQYQVYHDLSDLWAKQQRQRIADFADYAGEVPSWTGEDFQMYLARHIEDGKHPNTVRKYANQLRAFFGWMYATQRITGDQYMQLKSVGDPRGASGQSKPNPYSPAELTAFFAAVDERYPIPDNIEVKLRNWLRGRSRWRNVWRYALRRQIEAIVALALHCGLRREEIFNLTVDQVHYDNEYVVVTGKGDKMRWVPYTQPARDAVQVWLEMRTLIRPDHGSVWLSCFGAAWNKPMQWTRFKSLLPEAVGPGWTLHRFRHTFATERLRAGVPLEIVSRALGHASIQQTLAYAEIVGRDISREMARSEEAFVKAVTRAA